MHTGRIDIDLDAITANVRRLRRLTTARHLMSVVKADAYGHGLVPVARAAVAGGADWLGTAQPREALALRRAGLRERLLTWLLPPGAPIEALLAADIDVSASADWGIDDIARAARRTGRRARVHLKVDTGMGRAGAMPADLPALVHAARQASEAGALEIVGLWSHLAAADDPGHPSLPAQQSAFEQAEQVLTAAGLTPRLRHLANSAGLLEHPHLHYDLVRPGLAGYGLTPVPHLGGPDRYGLRPALTLSAPLLLVKRVAAGQGISYGHTYVTPADTTLGLVPLGYGDGIPRHASNTAQVWVNGRRAPVRGRVCMDQFVVDLGPDAKDAAGARVLVFGPGDHGEPTAQDWADAAGTISYEIVTRLSDRIPRHYQGGGADWAAADPVASGEP
ncbi:MAG: alanine racemase [Actinomycetales bacterium]